MGFIYFVGILVLAGVLLAGFVRLFGWQASGPTTPVTLVAVATSEAQLALFTGALQSAGVWYKLEDRSLILPHGVGAPMGLHDIRVWVRDEDLEGARAALGVEGREEHREPREEERPDADIHG